MEMWKTIPYETLYEVSENGKIRNKETGHIKSTRFDKYGYPRVTLYPSGKTYTIHRLIMTSFYSKEEWKEHINHIDNNRSNSTLSNLEWCTAKENVAHMHNQNRNNNISGSLNPMSKITDKIARSIKYEHKELSNKEVGQLYGISRMAATRIRKSESWKHI